MPHVIIYTRKFCGFCTAAKRLLTQKGVEFEEIDATFDNARRSEMIERAKSGKGGSTFPQIFIGDQHVGGCDDLYALDQAGGLDPMLRG